MWDTGPKPLKLGFVIDLDNLATKGSSERPLLEEIDLTKLPRHIAIIMDGNGRWAKQRGSPRVEGHRLAERGARFGIAPQARQRDAAMVVGRGQSGLQRNGGFAGRPVHGIVFGPKIKQPVEETKVDAEIRQDGP